MRDILSALLLFALLSACGYKGPLYLPKDKPQVPATSAPPADDTRKAKEGP
jgi:predicted small lipoprotein YifL